MSLRYLFLIVAALFTMASCSDSEPSLPGTGDSTQSPGERTVLVYMVAANTLGQSLTVGGVHYGPADEEDIAEMIRGAASLPAGRRVLLYHDTYNSVPSLSEVTSSGLKKLKEYTDGLSSLDRERMRAVIADARAVAPADNFGLVLWSHANGWLQDGTSGTSNSKAKRSFGIDRGRRLNVTNLADYLPGEDLEFLYFDCCLMASVEVVYELRHCTPLIVASTAELPRPGMPYDLCLPLMMNGGEEGLTACASTTYDYYVNNSNPDFRTCAISVIRTAGLDNLAAATARIYDGAPLSHQGESVTNYNANGRTGNWIDFGEYATSLTSDPRLLTDFDAAMDQTVIYQASTPSQWMSYPVYNSSGLSTYVFSKPDDYTYRGYDQLQWAHDVVNIYSRTY